MLSRIPREGTSVPLRIKRAAKVCGVECHSVFHEDAKEHKGLSTSSFLPAGLSPYLQPLLS